MTTYNVAVQVVELIDAQDEQDAIRRLTLKLKRAGFEVVDKSGDAFESEDV